MLITKEFLDRLSPVEITFIRCSIDKLYKDKEKHETTNYENVNLHVECW